MKLIPALRLELSSHAPDVVTIVGGGGKTSLLFRLAREIVEAGGRVVTATTTRVTVRQWETAPARLRLADDAVPWDALARALDEHGHCMLAGSETLLDGKQTGVSRVVIDSLAAAAERLGISAILVEGDGSRTLPVKAPGDHEPVIAASTTLVLPVMGLEAIGAPLDETHAHRPERIRLVLGVEAETTRLTPEMAARLMRHAEGGAKSVPATARVLPVFNKADASPALVGGRIAAQLLADEGYSSLLCAAGNPERDPVVERWGPVGAIVLAAGESRRYGAPKQMASVGGETFVHRAVRMALESGAQLVIVVTGAFAAEVDTTLDDLRAQYPGRLALQHNPRWAEGQSTSMRAGIDALAPQIEAVAFLPVDQPRLESALLRRLVDAWRRGAPLVAPIAEGEIRGAPALFDRSYLAALSAVTGDRGGRAVLRQFAGDVVSMPANAGALADVDGPEDWAESMS